MRKAAILVCTVFTLLSCSEDTTYDDFDSSKPYYKFTDSDSPYLLKSVYKRNTIINFRNQNNEALSFKVISNEQERMAETMSTFWGTSSLVYFYFDCRTIWLKSITHPEDYRNLKLNIYKGSNNNTFGGFSFYLWNEFGTGAYLNNNRSYNLSSFTTHMMQVNGVTYYKVIYIDSDSPYSYNGENYTQNVNKMYYDLEKGVIGFDDLAGNQWRLTN